MLARSKLLVVERVISTPNFSVLSESYWRKLAAIQLRLSFLQYVLVSSFLIISCLSLVAAEILQLDFLNNRPSFPLGGAFVFGDKIIDL